MESMDKAIDTIMDKKKGYDYDGDDFAAPTELTVTITLHEYRNLVERVTSYREDNATLREKCKGFEAECAHIKEELAKLKKVAGGDAADIDTIVVAVLKAMNEKKVTC